MISVAVYCRVSTDREDQINSFSSQQRYFREFIQSQVNWNLYEIYADEGITGTSTKKRIRFHQMMDDARSGKFSLILTKEVSRFSRNILDTVSYTRELRRFNVGVLFLNDGINTMDADAELRLSILGSIAQEESRRTSQRVKWGQNRQMEQGVVFGHSLLGYNLKNGVLSVEPEGAEIVRSIFRKYALEKKSSSAIANELGCSWTSGKVIRILKNEKYAGDLVQKKTYTPDYLSHEKKKNRGQEPMIVLHDHHDPIISRALWEETQRELQKRSRKPGTGESCSNQYSLSGKIHCGHCGHVFVIRSKKRKDGSFCRRWICGGYACTVGKTLRDDLAKEAVYAAVKSLNCNLINELIGLMQNKKKQNNKMNRKVDAILELYASGQISYEEMQRNYDRCKTMEQVDMNKTEIRDIIEQLLTGMLQSDIYIKTILSGITVFQDRRLELYLTGIDAPWVFVFA